MSFKVSKMVADFPDREWQDSSCLEHRNNSQHNTNTPVTFVAVRSCGTNVFETKKPEAVFSPGRGKLALLVVIHGDLPLSLLFHHIKLWAGLHPSGLTRHGGWSHTTFFLRRNVCRSLRSARVVLRVAVAVQTRRTITSGSLLPELEICYHFRYLKRQIVAAS